MTERKPPKKSDVLEVRLPHGTKQAFMQKARDEGRPASELIRDFIDHYLVAGDIPQPSTWERTMTIVKKHASGITASLVAAIAAAAIGAGTLPVTAFPDLKAAFGLLDANGDGVVTLDEFSTPRSVSRSYPVVPADTISIPAATVPALPAEPAITEAPQAGVSIDRLPSTGPEDTVFLQTMPAPTVPADRLFVARGTVAALPSISIVDGSAFMAEEFAAMDKDADGKLSYGEFEARHKAMLETAFTEMDLDGNGMIDLSELTAASSGAGATLRQFDRNGDKQVSLDEFAAPQG
jgi:Ca2+-binding EF-hand superfamily protein